MSFFKSIKSGLGFGSGQSWSDFLGEATGRGIAGFAGGAAGAFGGMAATSLTSKAMGIPNPLKPGDAEAAALDKMYPGTNSWERLGAGGGQAATAATNNTALRIAKINAGTSRYVADRQAGATETAAATSAGFTPTDKSGPSPTQQAAIDELRARTKQLDASVRVLDSDARVRLVDAILAEDYVKFSKEAARARLAGDQAKNLYTLALSAVRGDIDLNDLWRRLFGRDFWPDYGTPGVSRTFPLPDHDVESSNLDDRRRRGAARIDYWNKIFGDRRDARAIDETHGPLERLLRAIFGDLMVDRHKRFGARGDDSRPNFNPRPNSR